MATNLYSGEGVVHVPDQGSGPWVVRCSSPVSSLAWVWVDKNGEVDLTSDYAYYLTWEEAEEAYCLYLLKRAGNNNIND